MVELERRPRNILDLLDSDEKWWQLNEFEVTM
jgi:hypothetical protein